VLGSPKLDEAQLDRRHLDPRPFGKVFAVSAPIGHVAMLFVSLSQRATSDSDPRLLDLDPSSNLCRPGWTAEIRRKEKRALRGG
jgi:hypothetical protein